MSTGGKLADNFDKNGALLPKFSFLTCPSIKSLYLRDVASAECVAPFLALRKNAASASASDSRMQPGEAAFLAFPNLESLVLPNLSQFQRQSVGGFSPLNFHQVTGLAMRDFRSAVKERASVGKRLKRLEVAVPDKDLEVIDLLTWVEEAKASGWVEEEVVCQGLYSKDGEDGPSLLDEAFSDDEDD